MKCVSRYLRPAKHHTVEQDLEFLESNLAGTDHSILLNRGQNLVVPETRLKRGVRNIKSEHRVVGDTHMLHRTVTAVCTISKMSFTHIFALSFDLPSQLRLSEKRQCKDLQSHFLPVGELAAPSRTVQDMLTEIIREWVAAEESHQAI